MLESLAWAAPRCELSAARSFAVDGASQRSIEVSRSRLQSKTLLYSVAVLRCCTAPGLAGEALQPKLRFREALGVQARPPQTF